MGRVLISEPDPEVRDLLSRVVTRLGHEAVFDGEAPETLDVIVLEPIDSAGLDRVRLIRKRCPEVRIVCASIEQPTEASSGLQPVAHLLKPFSLAELEGTLEQALAAR